MSNFLFLDHLEMFKKTWYTNKDAWKLLDKLVI